MAWLRVAWSELSRHPFHEAVPRIRARAASGAGHATLELAWARLVEQALADDGGAVVDFDAFLAAHPELRDPDRVLRHYSPERLGQERARREFVLPDRLPLPTATPGDTPGSRRAAPPAGASVGKRSDPGRDSAPGPAEPSLACGIDRNRRTRP